MKVLSLRVSQFHGIEAVELAPDGSSVTIAGSNGAGKSSVLDAIQYALTGVAVEPVVRAGAERAEVEVALEGWSVTRSVSATGKDRLVVRPIAADGSRGAPKGSPQTFLDSLVGAGLAFDPLRFEALKPAAQVEVLLRGLGFDPAAQDKARADLYRDRTETGRRQKEVAGEVAALATPDVLAAPDAFDAGAASSRVAALRAAVLARSRKAAAASSLQVRVDALRRELAEAEAELAEILDELEEVWESEVALVGDAADLDAALAAAEADLSASSRIAVLVERKARLADRRAAAASLAAAYADATAAIDEIDAAKRASIAGANLGIDDLSVTEAGLVVGGLPLAVLNLSARIRVGLRIGARLSKSLRFVLIDEGSALDSASMAALIAAADELGLQVFIARVADSSALSFEIWEGGS